MGPRDSFKLLLKQNPTGPRESFKLLQKQNARGSPDSFRLLQKQDKGSPRFFQTTSKTKQWIPEIISNYFKNKTRGPLDVFKLCTSKTRDKGSLRFFQTTSKTKPNESTTFFQITSKTKHKKVPEILSNSFKNKIQKGSRDSFKLCTLKTRHNRSLRLF